MPHVEDEHTPVDRPLLLDNRWRLVVRVSTSQSFAKSPRLVHLLKFLCEQALLGRTDLLTEQNIADRVFDRKFNFDPGADTIVRSQMLRLRKRLETHFREEGSVEPVVILIPKGGYLPLFQEAESVPEGVDVDAESTVTFEKPRPELLKIDNRWPAITWVFAIACVVMAVFCTFAVIHSFSRISTNSIPDSSPYERQLWKSLFGNNRKTMIVAADSGLAILHGATNQNTSLSQYLSRDFHEALADIPEDRRGEVLAYAARRYTSFVDLELIDRLTHLPAAVRGDYTIRFARDINVNDLKSANVILSGSQDANPWIELFEPQMNFVLQDDLSRGIRAFSNRHPHQGEPGSFMANQNEYGVLALLPNLSGTGSVLIIEGTSVAGTQAISDFLFIDSEVESFLKSIARKNGTLPNFEILVGSRSLGGSAEHPRIVAYRIY